MSDYTLRQILRYKFDNFMARGGSSIFLTLVVLFLALLTVIAGARVALFFASGNSIENERADKYWGDNIYVTFLQLTDPGNMAQDINSSPYYKVFAILGGMTGVIFLSSLIAFITSALDQKLNELKKGHSKVVEDDHTLILGWSERVIEVLRELVIANESERSPSVVILSRQDKEEMDDFLKLHLRDAKNTRIVTRSGAESSIVNLELVSVDRCKSVIVLATCNAGAPDEEKITSDTIVTKTILALVATRPDDTPLNIVAELFDQRHRDIVEGISPEEITTINSDEILAKIMVQTSRSVGLSVVYSEILSFDGCEMYFHNAAWGGRTFGEIAFHFPDGVPMGVRHGDGRLSINPAIDTPMADDDEVLILAEDDSTIDFQQAPVAAARPMKLAGGRQTLGIEKELIIGWTDKVETILREYADYVLEGSSIDIMLRSPDEQVREEVERIDAELDKIKITLVDGDPLTREGLLSTNPWQYDNIVILSQGNEANSDERTDSETIIILLLLRTIFREHPEESQSTKLITEVLDSDNQALVARTGVHDFIISNRMVSMLLAQISEDADIKRVYDDLFSEDGSEIYLKPASLYFESFPAQVTFADMMGVAQQREEVCIGVKIKALEQDAERNFGVKLIPEKNARYTLHAEDSLVVVAEDET
ncbi:MAG: hypothetical protein RIC55_29145 [Pirellulaceae bacterium]